MEAPELRINGETHAALGRGHTLLEASPTTLHEQACQIPRAKAKSTTLPRTNEDPKESVGTLASPQALSGIPSLEEGRTRKRNGPKKELDF